MMLGFLLDLLAASLFSGGAAPQRRQQARTAAEARAPDPTIAEAAPPPEAPPEAPPRRHRLSDLERARLRHDKFLPMPPKPKREPAPRAALPTSPKREPQPESPVIPQQYAYYGPHHEDGEDVLYHQMEFNGQFSFRDTILDQLDRYFVYLKRMKKYDKDTYRFYRQVGAHIMPYSSTGARWEALQRLRAGADDGNQDWSKATIHSLPTWLKAHRPGFGCIVFGANSFSELEETFTKHDGSTLWTPRFLSFVKYGRPPHSIQAAHDGDVYKVSINWDKIKEDRSARQDFAMFISRDGSEVRPLPVLKTDMIHIRGRRGGCNIPRTGFSIPDCYEDWAKCHNVTVEWFLTDLFCQAMDSFVNANSSMVRIAASKEGMTAVFGVDVERLPYFFRDRDRIAGPDGRARRMFHYVKPHMRDGSIVPAHFRGDPCFKWGAYDIRITAPGYHHGSLLEFEAGSYDTLEAPRGKRMISEGKLGRILKEYVEGKRHGNWK
jgi:hypothetical protein